MSDFDTTPTTMEGTYWKGRLDEAEAKVTALEAEKKETDGRSKAYWRKQARQNGALLRGTRIMLAGLVHKLDGRATIPQVTLAAMSEGRYMMHSKPDPTSKAIEITVTTSPEFANQTTEQSLVDPEENEA